MSECRLDRRRFLKLSSAGLFGTGLVLAMSWDDKSARAHAAEGKAGTFQPNAWLKVGTDGEAVVYTVESEMGQGPYTLMPMILAEELEVDWSHIRVEHAPLAAVYGYQLTGGSSSIRKGWATLRAAGASAREMLITAAARQWGVARADCFAAHSQVVHRATDKRLSFGQLALAAAALPLPAKVSLKTPDQYRILGTAIPRLDIPQKVDGSARYGLDVTLPDMLYATTVHSPVLGGRPLRVAADQAKAIPGVLEVFTIDNAVAVVAEDTWSAMKAAGKVEIQWEAGVNGDLNSAGIRDQLRQAATEGGDIEFQRGDAPKALASSNADKNEHKIEASYDLPFQAHAPMEPMNCTAWVRDDACEVWAPTQSPSAAHEVATEYGLSTLASFKDKVARRLNLGTEDAVKVHTTLLGGGFGRRLKQDYVAEAVQISKQVGKPVKLAWRREEDIQHDFYHPYTFHLMDGAVDGNGKPVAWWHRFAGVGHPGAAKLPYAIANVRIEGRALELDIPTGPWRSVSHHYYAFAQETFFDELARLGGQDPLELRLALLQDTRLRGVLELAAEKAGWGKALPDNHYLGLAVHHSFGTYVAEAVEIMRDEQNQIRVPRVVVAIDCGIVINPDIVAAQMESSVAFGLSAALKGSIRIEQGRVVQSNYHDFPILRLDEMPKVETYSVKSTASPQGIGEPGVPPLAPALANAIFAATGRPVRSLPIDAAAFS
jgi:isoquinoline 1-oxidoreductase beta subunit